MSRESEIAREHALAPSDMGKNIDRRLYPTHDCPTGLQSVRVTWPARR